FSGGRRSPSTLEAGMSRGRGFSVVSAHLNGPLREFCNGVVEFGMLAADVGYLRIRGFGGYSEDGAYNTGLVALEAALDTVFAEARAWKGLVLDLRLNTGGADPY